MEPTSRLGTAEARQISEQGGSSGKGIYLSHPAGPLFRTKVQVSLPNSPIAGMPAQPLFNAANCGGLDRRGPCQRPYISCRRSKAIII